MATYARSAGGVVVEVITAAAVPGHPDAGFVDTAPSVGVAPGWTYDGKTFSPPVRTTGSARVDLAAHRFSRTTFGVLFQASGAAAPSLFATDRASLGVLGLAAVTAMNSAWPAGAPWKAADGSFVPMTGNDVQALAKKAGAYVAACYTHEAALSATLATNPVADITQGWPANE